jgi:hypothetical protein
VLFQPAAFAGGAPEAVMCGELISRLIVTLVLAELPATSVAAPEIDWFAPSVLIVCGLGQFAIPDNVSEHWKVTVTAVLFH